MIFVGKVRKVGYFPNLFMLRRIIAHIPPSSVILLKTEFFYPQDYSLLPSSHPVYRMKEKGMTAVPIEIIKSKGGVAPFVLGGEFFNYMISGSQIVLPLARTCCACTPPPITGRASVKVLCESSVPVGVTNL
jgi:hypothetical protein